MKSILTDTFYRGHEYKYIMCLQSPLVSQKQFMSFLSSSTEQTEEDSFLHRFVRVLEKMEPLGAFPDGEWDSFSKMFFTDDQELDFTPQFLGHECSFLLEHDEAGLKYSRAPSTSCPDSEAANMRMTGSVNDSLLYSLDCLNSNLHFISQESSSTSSTNNSNSSSSIFIATPSHENYQYFSDANHIQISNDISMFTNICMMDDQKNIASFFTVLPDVLMGETVYNNELDTSLKGSDALEDGKPAAVSIPVKELIPKRKFDMPESQTKAEGRNNNQSSEQNSKKKPRVSSRSDVRKSKKNVDSKENLKLPNAGTSQEEKSNIAGPDGQSSTSYCSEDDNASQEINGGATSESKAVHASISLSGKSRASRGSATDPQSLYARKRRERINERLKILQNLVPNGTKVDISTMLEEAVHYVKFLQLQIKLLSSDDLWMYAPIAYNGMDIGLINQKISPVPDL